MTNYVKNKTQGVYWQWYDNGKLKLEILLVTIFNKSLRIDYNSQWFPLPALEGKLSMLLKVVSKSYEIHLLSKNPGNLNTNVEFYNKNKPSRKQKKVFN